VNQLGAGKRDKPSSIWGKEARKGSDESGDGKWRAEDGTRLCAGGRKKKDEKEYVSLLEERRKREALYPKSSKRK